jgi:phenylpropionate dioxygenase-like ring-hydroxylating dioxygenase large terminal subunit
MIQFLRNVWYLGCWVDEVQETGMLARTIAGEPLLFLADGAGGISVLRDACPHRFAPLSLGTCEQGIVRCAYHGLAFDAAGDCVDNPHGPIVKALSVKRYPSIARHAAVWVWLGEQFADPTAIPDFGFIDRTPPEARVTGYLHNTADYRLMIDNIMDLTHADYIHASTLGGGINTRAKAKVSEDENSVTIEWTAENDRLAPLHAQFVTNSDAMGDFLNRVTWFAPGNMLQRIMLANPGEMATAPVDSMTCHVMTREGPHSTHYFFCHTSDGVTANPAIAPVVLETLVGAFSGEDAPMLRAQDRRIGDADFCSLGPALLPSDKGAVMVRRALESRIASEARP